MQQFLSQSTTNPDQYLPSVSNSESEVFPWYAIRVRSNFESTVSTALRGKGYDEYAPTYRKKSKRNDKSEAPLFPGYVFGRFDINRRLPVLTTPGVVSIVSFGKDFIPVPQEELEAVRAVVRSGLPSKPWPCLREGDWVRIEKGSLAGVEGPLVQLKNELRLVVSISLLNRSVAVEVDRDWIQPTNRSAVRPSVSAASPGLPNARPQTKIANDQHPAFG